MKGLVVIGSQGQLARALKALSPEAVFLDRSIIDLEYPERIEGVLSCYQPTAILNAAAHAQVDKAETEEALANTVNAAAPEALAKFCHARSIPFISFSSDYVFDGSGDTPWRETDIARPLNAYGRSKLEGEKRIAAVGGKYLIFRTSWVYDAEGKNFLTTMLRLLAEREELKVINDQFGAPTYAKHLAQGTLKALAHAMEAETFPSGLYHLCNGGVTTWHGFTSAIAGQACAAGLAVKTKNIIPIPASEYPLPARRPHNSRLDCTRALSMLGVALPPWEQGLHDAMEGIRENI